MIISLGTYCERKIVYVAHGSERETKLCADILLMRGDYGNHDFNPFKTTKNTLMQICNNYT